MADLTQTLIEADALLRIARTALQKMRLEGLGSDCRLSHEVRMFALEFSRESRDGPGVLQVNGTGRALKCLEAIRAALAQAEPVRESGRVISVDQLSKMAESVDGMDRTAPGYHWRRGWNDALRRAMDYAAPQQAEPVQRKPLTEEEIEALFKGVDSKDKGRFAIVRGFARAIEAAHGIKGGGNG